MKVDDLVRTWEQLSEADKSWILDNVGEHLEKFSGVTSDAGRLGRIDGIDSRALSDAFDFSCRRIKGEIK